MNAMRCARERLSASATESSGVVPETILEAASPRHATAVSTPKCKTKRERTSKKLRGVFEKVPDSGVWWIQYFDADGRRRREKAGSKGNAIDLYRKRKNEVLTGKKLPE